MNTHASLETLALFSAGDLEGKRQKTVALHVNGCPDCLARVAEFRSASATLGTFALEPSTDDLQAVRETIIREIMVPGALRLGWLWWAVGAAAILLLLTFSLRQSVTERSQIKEAVLLPPTLLPEIPLVVRRQRNRPPMTAGLRKVSFDNGALKITTADPSVIILLPLEEGEKK